MVLAEFFWLLILSLAFLVLLRRPWLFKPGPTALEILRQRYARGEIDRETFEQMRMELSDLPQRSQRSQRSPVYHNNLHTGERGPGGPFDR
ncbi:MAG: SHOCT domain-containing protein [Ktedonobacteraceae bacterium]|nr:SHOCT domain-containing protein [Ktedonobacteraceae bacterium]